MKERVNPCWGKVHEVQQTRSFKGQFKEVLYILIIYIFSLELMIISLSQLEYRI